MINVKQATGHVIAGESTAMLDAADHALLSSARMTVTILEATVETRLDPRTKQKLLEAMSAGQSKLIEGRKDFTSVHSQLVVLQRKTNLAEVNWGCDEARRVRGNHSSSSSPRAVLDGQKMVSTAHTEVVGE